MHKFLITIVGPTAIGKTAAAIQLAKYYNTEIISADSRQFYKEMSIGTAVPTNKELSAVPHHFIQNKSIENDYDVGSFERDAILTIDNLFKKYNQLLLVGGSGLYVKAITTGLNDFPEVNPGIRQSLNKLYKEEGLNPLLRQLKNLDPKTYETIDLKNPHRVIRALEVCLGSDKPFSFYKEAPTKKRPFKLITIGLEADRSIIYDRINKRVDQMIDEGLVKEVESLIDKKHLNALNTVGYKEIIKYLRGDWTLDFAISEIKKNTRRFAKRQLTWFKKDDSIEWFNYNSDPKTIIKYIDLKMAQDEMA